MNALRLLAVGVIVCAASAGARAEDKTDYAKMLVGKWEVTKADAGTVPPGTIIEFTKDGKFIVEGKKDDTAVKHEGTYTVEKDTFTFKVDVDGMERTQTVTIKKISDKEMSTTTAEGKAVELKKK
jgi:uncharacterized protein (TIGR03066 family)